MTGSHGLGGDGRGRGISEGDENLQGTVLNISISRSLKGVPEASRCNLPVIPRHGAQDNKMRLSCRRESMASGPAPARRSVNGR